MILTLLVILETCCAWDLRQTAARCNQTIMFGCCIKWYFCMVISQSKKRDMSFCDWERVSWTEINCGIKMYVPLHIAECHALWGPEWLTQRMLWHMHAAQPTKVEHMLFWALVGSRSPLTLTQFYRWNITVGFSRSPSTAQTVWKKGKSFFHCFF